MKCHTALRLSVALFWAFFLVDIVLIFLLDSTLPAELRAWHSRPHQQPTALEITLNLLGGLGFVLMVVATVGLWCLRRWGAQLSVLAIILAYAVTPFYGPTVEPGFVSSVSSASTLFLGMALAIAFFTDALKPAPQSS